MFARGRSHRAYRVYAEDDFLEAEASATEGAVPLDDPFAEAPSYTAAARRGMPAPLEGRVGVVLIALVAMAVSALVMHALRAGLDGGGDAPHPANPRPAAVATPADGRAAARGGVRARVDALGISHRAGSASFAAREESGHARRDRAERLVVRGGAIRAPRGADRLGRHSAQVVATTSATSEADSPSATSTAAPEFGFERWQR